MVFWVSHSVDYCIKIKYNNFPFSHVVVEVSCVSPQPCSQGPLLMSPGVRETKEKLERTLGTRLIQSSGHIIYMYGHFPFNKNSSLKFQKFHGPNGTYIPVAQNWPKPLCDCYCTCKQDTEERHWVQPSRWSQKFWSDRTKMVRSIWFLTKISRILGWMESTYVSDRDHLFYYSFY